MPYVIDPKVTINGVEYKDKAINGITLTSGRARIDEQPRSGFASIVLVTADDAYPTIQIDEKVVVKIDNSSGVETTIWTGWVSDIQTTVIVHGGAGWLNEQRITAIGSLSKLDRRRVGAGGYSAAKDGDRIYDIIYETAGETWEDWLPADQQWQQVSPLLQWQNVDLLIGTIDRPGDFDLVAYSAGAAAGLQLAQNAAISGLGILFENAEGKICYDDSTSRTDDVSVNGFTDIPSSAILAEGLSSISRLGDLINQITVTYGSASQVTEKDDNSIDTYGLYASGATTQLANLVDAQQRAEFYMTTRAYPRTTLNAINLALHLDGVADVDRDALIPMRMSLPIEAAGLPKSLYPNTFQGFVEGYTWTINRNELFLTLIVSEYGFSQLSTNWLQVTPSLQWEDVNATLEWQEARVVA